MSQNCNIGLFILSNVENDIEKKYKKLPVFWDKIKTKA